MTEAAPSRLEQLKQQVDDVHAISKLFVLPGAAKQAFVSARVAQLMPDVPQQQPAEDPGHVISSQYLLLKGKLLDSLPPSARKGADARNMMAASGKLQPRSADTWSALGHSLWEAGDVKDAYAVFSYALDSQQLESAPLAVNMGMLCRSLATSPAGAFTGQDPSALVRESLRLAKRAVKVAPSSCDCWYNLGNALFSSYFICTGAPADLQHALQAYDKAQQLFLSATGDVQRYTTMLNRMSYYPADAARVLLKAQQRITIEFPDLHYNRATVLKYLEEYGAAIAEFKRAEVIDPSFMAPTCHSAELAAFCCSVRDALGNKCKITPSRVLQMQNTVKSFSALAQAQGQHRLLPLVTIQQLQQGEPSAGTRLEVIVLRTFQCDSQASVTAIVMDVDASVVGMSFLTDPELLRPGDILSLPSPPPIRHVQWEQDDGAAAADSFLLMRIEDVTSCIRNGKEALKSRPLKHHTAVRSD